MPAPIVYSKRPRAQTDDGGSLVDVTTATSSLRHDSNKRPRLSVALSEDEDDDESVYDEHSENPTSTFNNYRPEHSEQVENYEDRRDGEFEDLRFQVADDQRATQIVEARMKEVRQNQAADNAIIEEIKCQNFMCHSLLTVKVGPLINFVIGHNGSGKSAVLTALTLCLGGKATATNRGQSLKSFIKEGEEQAVLSVKIKNQGSAAYKPELYGQSIIVERYFSKAGSSGFKIKNALGKIISTKRQDLEDITDAFALQLDNPMNVLTQDMARQFLNHSTPSDKYKFFIKGTQLEQLDHDYRMLEENLERMDVHLQREQDNVEVHDRKYRAAEEKLKRSERQLSMRERYNHYCRQYVWMQVAEQEEYIATLQQQVDQADDKILEKAERAQEASTIYDSADRDLELAKTNIEELQESRGPSLERYEEALERFNVNKSEMVKLTAEQRTINSAIQVAERNIASTRQKIQEERQRQEDALGGAHADKLAEIQESKDRVQEARNAHETYTANFQNLNSLQSEAVRRQKQADEYCKAKRDEVRRQETTISNLQRKQGNWADGYDSSLQKLLRLIREEQRFKEAPVGPFGKYVKLKDPEWSSVLESNFGAVLNSFAVSCKEDQELLSSLTRQAQFHCQIVIGSAVPVDTSGHEPDESVDSILRILDIADPRVRNQLIINNAIDQTVLIKDREKANQFMYRSGVPKNVRLCLTLHETNRKRGFSLRYTNSGARSLQPIQEWRQLPRMQSDVDSRLSMEKSHLARLQEELTEAENETKEKTSARQRCDRELQQHKRRENELLLQRQNAEDRVERLQEDLEAATPRAGLLEQLEAQLESSIEEKTIPTLSLEQSKQEIKQIGKRNADIKKLLDRYARELNDVDERILNAQTSEGELRVKRERALQEKNLAFAQIADADAEKAFIVREKRSIEQTLEEDYIAKARTVCERVALDAGVSVKGLEAKMEKLQQDITNAQTQLGGTREQLKEIALEAKADLEKAKRDFRIAETTTQALKNSMIDRQDRWKKFRRFISSRARILFSYLLSERGFRGTLIIDPASKVLDIKVEPDITRNSAKGRQTKTLSGGEKSFSTICLLLSLWDAMGSPIRCLDEFDVFMDNVNRDISMRMMIQAARRSVSRQFILITPQAMGNVAFAEDVKIIKMGDPERGQTTLPFNS